MTLTRRILIHVAAGTALVIAVVSVVTYRRVYADAEARAVEHLDTYAVERVRRLESELNRIYRNLETVRGLLLKREEDPIPDDIQQQWDHLIVRDPDRAWRSRKDVTDPLIHATLWGSKDLEITPLAQHRMLNARKVADDLMPTWSKSFPSVYIMFPGAACIGFNPLQPYWEWETPADFPLEEQEWYRIATPEFNPSRGFAWTGLYTDEVSNIPYMSVLLPVENEGVYLCTIGHDIDLVRLFDELTISDFTGAIHLIFQQDGRLIAHPDLRSQILASNGALRMQDAGDPALVSLYQNVISKNDKSATGYEPLNDSYFAFSPMPKTGWLFVTTMPRSLVRSQALQSARWVWYSGLSSLALLLVTFSAILRREIGQPLAVLSHATEAMSAGNLEARANVPRADDFGLLADSFNQMVARVAKREGDLRQLNLDLEQRVDERTAELNESLTHERELGEMKSNFVSLVSHEFRTPLGVIMSAADVLAAYYQRLAPEKRARHIEMILRSTRNLSTLIDEVLLLGRVEDGRLDFSPVPVVLEKFCRSLCDEMYSASSGACPIRFESTGSLDGANSDESVLRHILTNLLSNAVKYSEPGTLVDFRASRVNGDVIFTVRDRGIGIPLEDQANLFTSFTRGGNVGNRPGTGLGLVVVRRCAELHGGSVTLESKPDEGTLATVILPIFPNPSTP